MSPKRFFLSFPDLFVAGLLGLCCSGGGGQIAVPQVNVLLEGSISIHLGWSWFAAHFLFHDLILIDQHQVEQRLSEVNVGSAALLLLALAAIVTHSQQSPAWHAFLRQPRLSQLPAWHGVHGAHPTEALKLPVLPNFIGGEAAENLGHKPLLSSRQLQLPAAFWLARIVNIQPPQAAVHTGRFEGRQSRHHNLEVVQVNNASKEGDRQFNSVCAKVLGLLHITVADKALQEKHQVSAVKPNLAKAIFQQVH
mmetsp:Transcript_12786/g.17557  ORF Transcript_12786/g.17557 Transcript_12786/m.17557 type:complete len:251 (+) Transcript_12786:69-821(+)